MDTFTKSCSYNKEIQGLQLFKKIWVSLLLSFNSLMVLARNLPESTKIQHHAWALQYWVHQNATQPAVGVWWVFKENLKMSHYVQEYTHLKLDYSDVRIATDCHYILWFRDHIRFPIMQLLLDVKLISQIPCQLPIPKNITISTSQFDQLIWLF